VVAVESDVLAAAEAYIREDLRLESIRACSLVDDAFIFNEPIISLIDRYRPDVILKGKEHESGVNPEREVVAAYGGRLIFSSGESQFSSADLLRCELLTSNKKVICKPDDFMFRHGIDDERVAELVDRFSKLNVLTLGDLIVDDYINCQALGMSQEDPTIVVMPVDKVRFLGGAGVVSAHAAGLGAVSHLISVVGGDNNAIYCSEELKRLRVRASLTSDDSRPTTTKERYRSGGKTLLRVSRLHQSDVSLEIQKKMLDKVREVIGEVDLVIFSDFNYGCLPTTFINEVTEIAQRSNVLCIADSQSSSQLGDITRFQGVHLIAPTEREARISTQNKEAGLVQLAEQVRSRARAKNVLLKLAEDGVLVHAEDAKSGRPWLTDRIEALNKFPQDPAGAGDSMLVASGLTLAAGGDIWEAALIGSIAAAIQVGRLGNVPVSTRELKTKYL
jgi:rfaE bifunctional protein kinase chain/domain